MAIRIPSALARRGVVLVAAAAAMALGSVPLVAAMRSADLADAAAACPTSASIKVTVAAELVQPVSSVLKRLHQARALDDADPRCPVPTVTVGDPANMAEFLASAGSIKPDVWIPDSTMWVARSAASGLAMSTKPTSLARSPLVAAVAVDGVQARALSSATGWGDLLPSGGSPGVRLGLPAPKRLTTTMGALVALRSLAQARPGGAADLTAALRAAKLDVSGQSPEAWLGAAVQEDLVVPATEQQVAAYNRSQPKPTLRAIYPADTSAVSLDYPFVILASDPARQARAATLLAGLQDETGRAALAAAGFRDASGAVGAQFAALAGVDGARPGVGRTPDPAAVVAAVGALDRVTLGSQVLAVVDVSGSMAQKVPGSGGASRLDLALRAAVAGLAAYPDDTKAGLWEFSTELTPTTDYRVLAPLGALGKGEDGVSGRQRMSQGLAQVRVKPDGSTGLYDTTLAAVREVRAHWDPTKVNSVIIITDGANEDPHGLDLPALLSTLTSEHDPAKPVWVFPVAYGPSSDVSALEQIVGVTGGKVYQALDPLTIGQVIQDAIGLRAA